MANLRLKNTIETCIYCDSIVVTNLVGTYNANNGFYFKLKTHCKKCDNKKYSEVEIKHGYLTYG